MQHTAHVPVKGIHYLHTCNGLHMQTAQRIIPTSKVQPSHQARIMSSCVYDSNVVRLKFTQGSLLHYVTRRQGLNAVVLAVALVNARTNCVIFECTANNSIRIQTKLSFSNNYHDFKVSAIRYQGQLSDHPEVFRETKQTVAALHYVLSCFILVHYTFSFTCHAIQGD